VFTRFLWIIHLFHFVKIVISGSENIDLATFIMISHQKAQMLLEFLVLNLMLTFIQPEPILFILTDSSDLENILFVNLNHNFIPNSFIGKISTLVFLISDQKLWPS